MSHVLQTRAMHKSHTGSNIAELLKAALEEWDLVSKDPAIVTDNAANMSVAAELAGMLHFRCFAHTLNLASQRALKLPAVARLLGHVRRISTFLKRSITASHVLRQKQKLLELPEHKLITDVVTRWNSAHDMLERFLEQQPAVSAALLSNELRKTEKEVCTLCESDITSAEEMVDAMKPMKIATLVMSKESSPTLSVVAPLHAQLIQDFQESRADSEIVKEIKAAICQDLSKRYMDQQKETMYVCSALDPGFKALPFLPDDEREEIYLRITAEARRIQELFQEEAKVIPGEEDNHVEDKDDIPASPPPKKKKDLCCLADLLGSTYSAGPAVRHRTTQAQAEEEMSRYKEAPPLSLAEGSPLSWWKEHQNEYPLMSRLAKVYLCIPGTSVSSERVFSTAGDIVTAQRSEPPQENPQTSIQELTVDTDPLESQPVFDRAQATQSSAVVSAESSSDVIEDTFENLPADASEPQNNPTDASEPQNIRTTDAPEQQNSPTEKHTKGRKGRACFQTVRKAVKRHFRTLKAKVCPCVPDQEPPQENPQTSIQELTVDTDPLESQTVCNYAQATQSSAVVSAESSSDVFEDAFEYLPTDASEPQNDPTDAAQPQSGSDMLEDAFEYLPTDASEPQNNRTDASEAQSSSDVFEDAFEYLPADASEPQNDPTDASEAQSSSDVFEDAFEYLPADASEPQNNRTDASEAQSSSDVFEDAFEYLPTDASEPQNDPTDAAQPQSGSDMLEDALEYLPTDASEPQNNRTDASEAQSSSDVFEDALEYLPTDASEPQNDPTDASEAQSSSAVLEDAFKYLPVETESSRDQPSCSAVVTSKKHPSSGPTDAPEQQNSPTEKHRKKKGKGRTHIQIRKAQVCPRMADQKQSQESSETSIEESTSSIDPLEYQQLFDYSQWMLSSTEVSAESSSDVFEDAFEYLPTDAPEPQNNPREKRTKGKKKERTFITMLKAQLYARMAKQKQLRESSETSTEETISSRDLAAYQELFAISQWTPSCSEESAESSSDTFEDAFEYLPTGAPEPQNNQTEAPKPQNNPTEAPEPQNNPTEAPEPQNNPTEAPEPQNNPRGNCRRKCRRARACFRRVRKAVKRRFQTLKAKMCPCVPDREPPQERPQERPQENPRTSTQELIDSACSKVYPQQKSQQVEEMIAVTLKHAPHREKAKTNAQVDVFAKDCILFPSWSKSHWMV
ncbi:zinc finger BED domain-containing 1-like protein [Labeo rohita]|uniref:Zinc finger BED domain-containing 1-like protein n=1 Tax=Labeo rohita TaxID=84645 RepID=A0A498N5K5_LABRO|nr:zinc finger BED domain-containing 1-like protein [Labeo rohita]